MVKGLKLFTDFFKDFQDTYILIGGAATEIWMEEVGLPFRATKDLDVILVLEALNENFIKHFWKFIEATKANPPDYKQLAKNFGVALEPEKVFQQLIKNFQLDGEY